MNQELYERFKLLLAQGKKREAIATIKLFVDSFVDLQERLSWAHWFFQNESFGHRVRHELYQGVLFPALMFGYRKRDPWSIQWLARTAQNLYQAKSLWQELDFRTDYQLFKELVALEPSNNIARSELLDRQLEWFRYAEHEWPIGILYGINGATPEECDDILAEVNLARQLDDKNRYTEYLNEFAAKVEEYKKRPNQAL